MATYATSLANGKTNPQGLLRIFTKVFPDSGVLESSALTVSAQTSPDMTVKVSGSSLNDNAIFKTSSGHFIQAWNDADLNVTIAPNSSGSAKTDAIVLWVDLTDGDASNANNPGALRVSAIRGSSGSPNSGEITAVTGSNPYFVRANIAVANGASSINSGNITNLSPLSRIDGALIKASSIVFGALANESVGNANLKTGTGEPGGAWTDGSGLAISGWSSTTLKAIRYKKIGRTVVMNINISGTSNSNSITINLPYTAAAYLHIGSMGSTTNNGTESTGAARWLINGPVSPTQMSINSNMSTGLWTNSGTKSVYGVITYEAVSD